MEGHLAVLGLVGALPAAGSLAGGLLTKVRPATRRARGLALRLAAGIVLAVVGLELMPEALRASPRWVPLGAFVAGGGLFLLRDRTLGYVHTRLGSDEAARRPTAIFAGSDSTSSATG